MKRPQTDEPALILSLGPNKVRQVSQGSTDGSKTWTVAYDFTYIRNK